MRKKLPNKQSIRSLAQYKEYTDEEFEIIWQKEFVEERKLINIDDMDMRIARKMSEFTEDYDLTDLKINDRVVLRQLIQAMLQLEDLEIEAHNIREDGDLDSFAIQNLKDVNTMMTSLRKDISSMQNDLNITRKARKGDKEASVLSFLDDLKFKAKKFYESKMTYIYCPKCKMLLATIWVQYPEKVANKLQLTCGREGCGERFTVSLKEIILEKRGVNLEDVPESLK